MFRVTQIKLPEYVQYTDMPKKSKDRLRDPALYLTMQDHAIYPSTKYSLL